MHDENHLNNQLKKKTLPVKLSIGANVENNSLWLNLTYSSTLARVNS